MSDIKIIALGGVRENAKNMYVVEVDDNIYILDCGLKYPENELLGIDTVIPDFEYLRQNARRIVGVFLTHGHADAIGALPYFVSEFDVPVFGSELTIELAKIACANEDAAKDFDDFHIVDEKRRLILKAQLYHFLKRHTLFPKVSGLLSRLAKATLFTRVTLNLIKLLQSDIRLIWDVWLKSVMKVFWRFSAIRQMRKIPKKQLTSTLFSILSVKLLNIIRDGLSLRALPQTFCAFNKFLKQRAQTIVRLF